MRERQRHRHGHRRKRWQRKIAHRFGPDVMLLVGNLKVGKSTLFSWYVGRSRHQVSYPGTGVELAGGAIEAQPVKRLIDAPGFYSLLDRSEDAFVVRDILARRRVGGILLVLDAKNLRRGLALAMELAEFSLPVVVALNMIDEARQRGVVIDVPRLSGLLGVPVVPVVATEGRGLGQLKRAIPRAAPLKIRMDFPEALDRVVNLVESRLADTRLSARGTAYLAAAGVPRIRDATDDHLSEEQRREVRGLVEDLGSSAGIALTESSRQAADRLVERVVRLEPAQPTGWTERLSAWTRKRSTGIPMAIVILALTYFFVGWFGAGILVDLLEGKLFGELVLPALNTLVGKLPWAWGRELLIGPFGLLSLGLVLSLGIVLPVLATFFFAFALMEDSGYLARLSLLTDRALRKIGLNGKGVLPLIMGFSCVAMAILTTRVLDTRKQRVISTLLLILAVPCAPLLSVIMVVLADLSVWATITLFGMLLVQFLFVGVLANLLIPGERPDFILELPPLRAPRIRNTLVKTGHQIIWFLKEAIPYFVLGAFILFLLDQFGGLQVLRQALQPVSERLLGLPGESADVFFMTVIRREAGAALLAQQSAAGLYDGVQIVVTLLVMTLMVPCINSVLVMFKERGLGASLVTLLFVFCYSLLVGGLFNLACRWLEVQF